MALSVRALFDAQKTLAFGSISGSYAAVGTPFSHPIRMLLVQNFTDQLMQFSIDGTTDHFVVGANSGIIFDISTNKTSTSDELYFTQGMQLYVKQVAAPASGNVYASAIYGRND